MDEAPINEYQALMVGAFFAIITSLTAWKRGFYQFPLMRYPDHATLRFGEVFGAFLVFLTIALLITPFFSFIWISWQAGHFIDLNAVHFNVEVRGWLSVVSILMTVVGMGGYFVLLPSRARHAVWGPASFQGIKRILNDVFFGAMTWLVCYPLVMVMSQACRMIITWGFHPERHEQTAVQHLKMMSDYPWLFAVMAIFLVMVVPIIEEILFRGFLQRWLKQKLGFKWALLLTAALFAAFHYSDSQGFDNVELLASLFLLACFLGYVYERQQSLWASISLHAVFNAISVIAIITGKNI